MRITVIALLALLLTVTAQGLVIETGSMRAFLYGTEAGAQYDNWVSHLAEGIAAANYNLYAPYDRQTNGFGDFRIASVGELANWNSLIDLFLAQNWDSADLLIQSAGFPYQTVQFNDTDTGRTYFLLREIPDLNEVDDNGTIDPYDDETGAFMYGWGLFVYNPAGTRPIIVTVPHPCDDFTTPAFGLKCLEEWDARFLLINGAGREVKWTNVGSYANNKSLSDPSRLATHPLHIAYVKMADRLRADFNMREFSAQIHSYDWNRHPGYPNVQISAGYQRLCPNLPIRDLSSLKLDMINSGQHLMIPANTVGMHDPVYLNDFYGVNYGIYDFTFDDGVNTYPVNDYIDLPAYSQNQQMLYTQNGYTDYDVYEPFFHVEMDELPNSYLETNNSYYWFYGWDEASQMWDYSDLFTRFLDYYGRWVNDMDEVLDDMFTMNDGLVPTNPANLRVDNQSLNHITLAWDKTDCYDFDTYEILYATQPIGESNYQVFNRVNNAALASPDCESMNVTGLNNANQYFFRIRAKDKNSNISLASNEVNSLPAPANITNIIARGMPASVRLYWQVSGQTSNQGFKVYRKMVSTDWELMDSWETNAALSNPTGTTFEWWDYLVSNEEFYTYRISSTNTNNLEFFHNVPVGASPRAIHTITISNSSGSLTDDIDFGTNPYATDGQDYYWDVNKSNPTPGYVWNAFWEQYWGSSGTQLDREIKGHFNPDSEMKTWIMRTRSDQYEALTISASDTFGRAEKLILLDGAASTYHDLLSGPYTFTNSDSNIRTMTLYWGNMQGKVLFGGQPNKILQGGSSNTFTWNYQYPFLIDHIELSIQNDTDSLLVSSMVFTNQYSFAYIAPQQADMQNAKLVADVIGIDGERTRFITDYTFALVPAMNLAYIEPGWKMLSNPWPENPLNVQNLLGQTSQAYTYTQLDGWLPSQEFLFGTPVWAWVPDVVFYSSATPIQSTEYSVSLNDGWNFVVNPHLCAYDIQDLRFTVNDVLFRYSEMIAQELVSPAVFVYRDGMYRFATRIEPYEAFLIKYYSSDILFTQLKFYPFFHAPEITNPDPQWYLALDVENPDTKDSCVIGSNIWASDAYDFRYDLPKAPATPFSSVRLYVPENAPANRPEPLLHSKMIAPLSTLPEIKMFNVILETPDTSPLDFTCNLSIPDGWQVLLTLDPASHWYLQPGDQFTWTPPNAGQHLAWIRVSNYGVANDDNIQQPLTKLIAYPNPFNPEVNIAFDLVKTGQVEVEIFNIRGQKVKSIHSGLLEKGNQKLMWNGRDANGQSVASGVYFARIKTGKDVKIVKMMLIK
jgi:hypothetical protein